MSTTTVLAVLVASYLVILGFAGPNLLAALLFSAVALGVVAVHHYQEHRGR